MLIYKGFSKIMAIQITMPATFKPDYWIRITGPVPGHQGRRCQQKNDGLLRD